MSTAANIAVALVALLHLCFLMLEMFYWDKLGCVIVAGAFGAATVNWRILWVQALPAAIALALVLAA